MTEWVHNSYIKLEKNKNYWDAANVKLDGLKYQVVGSSDNALTAFKTGALDLVIGTHALLTGQVRFARLGLVITDEQHRFGVAQRNALAMKGEHPHRLVMSATPIPRTLAMMIYGDLDISIIAELPGGRIPIETYAVTGGYRERAYEFIRKQVNEGRQAYIVCPLIEQSETDLKSATEYRENIELKYFLHFLSISLQE